MGNIDFTRPCQKLMPPECARRVSKGDNYMFHIKMTLT